MHQIPEIKREDVLFRTHNFGELIPAVSSLSDRQKDRLKELRSRTKPLTENMVVEMAGLIENERKFAFPELSETGKALVLDMFNTMVRGTSSISTNTNATEKGKLNENMAIARIAKVNGWGVVLNANAMGTILSDEIGIGHPDALKLSMRVGFDAKCAYEDRGLQFFEPELANKNYIWQGKRLAMMAHFDQWHICYSLENTPEHIVLREARTLWIDAQGEGEPTESFIDDVRQMHNYDHLPDWARVKTFTVKVDQKDRDTARKYASMARDYFFKLLEQYKQLKPNL